MKEKKILRLGERELQLIFAFEERKQRLFTTKDAKAVLGGTDASVKNVLKRLKAKRRILHVERGKYLFAPMESGKEGLWTEESLAAVPFLVGGDDYCVGLLTALNYWGMTEQIPIVVYVITRKKKKGLEAFGARYVFVNMEVGDWVEREFSGAKVRISSVEQTIIDSLAMPRYALGVAEVAKGINAARKVIDWEKLTRLARAGKGVARRRLGFVLETMGLKKQSKALEEKFAGFSWLDPHWEKRRLGYSKKWGLMLNVPKEDLLEFKNGH